MRTEEGEGLVSRLPGGPFFRDSSGLPQIIVIRSAGVSVIVNHKPQPISRMGNSLSCTARTVDSLWKLQPGEHIRARGDLGEFVDSYVPELKVYTHHMLVVQVLSASEIRIIHKTKDRGVVEEIRSYQPEDITVFDYDCAYSGQNAVRRARERSGEGYNLALSNCEHFVTEVRTGTAQSLQVQTAVKVGIGALLGIGALAGGIAYMLNKKGNNSDSDEEQTDEEQTDEEQNYT